MRNYNATQTVVTLNNNILPMAWTGPGTNANLVVGINRTGFGIPTGGWPAGCGYTHYKYRVDGGAWSAQRPINSTITLVGLGQGPHHVDVAGKRDSGLYRDDPRFGADAVITRSRTRVIDQLRITSSDLIGNNFHLEFPAHTGETYTVQYRDALDAAPAWMRLTNVMQAAAGPALITDTHANPRRFYRIRTPALP